MQCTQTNLCLIHEIRVQFSFLSSTFDRNAHTISGLMSHFRTQSIVVYFIFYFFFFQANVRCTIYMSTLSDWTHDFLSFNWFIWSLVGIHEWVCVCGPNCIFHSSSFFFFLFLFACICMCLLNFSSICLFRSC